MKFFMVAAFVLLSWQANAAVGLASVDDGRMTRYDSRNYHGRIATGGRFNPAIRGVAHRTLPLRSCVGIRYRSRVVVATVLDRGPCASAHCRAVAPWLLKRVLDLWPATRRALGFPNGVAPISYWRTKCAGL